MMRADHEPSPSLTALIGAGGALLLLTVIILLQAFVYRLGKGGTARKTGPDVPAELARLRTDQQEKLSSYRWVDQPKGVVAIPIERAMALVVQEQARSVQGAPRR